MKIYRDSKKVSKIYLTIFRVWFVFLMTCQLLLQQDTVSNLRKAQALYVSRQQELERVRETIQKADGEKMEKRKKYEEEAMHKVRLIQSYLNIIVVCVILKQAVHHWCCYHLLVCQSWLCCLTCFSCTECVVHATETCHKIRLFGITLHQYVGIPSVSVFLEL